MKTLVHVNPLHELRGFDEMIDRLFVRPVATAPSAVVLPLDVYEMEGKFIVKASVPGVAPENLDVQIENGVLTIRGEAKHGFEESEVKLYRREISYGSFARSIRLPENLNLDEVDAQFSNGLVTIAIPRMEEVKPKARKVPIRTVPEIPTETKED
ncbi:MAG: Hsp20/alpha crystallin family protein [Fimbriimonadaceae bacterium]|nr:Hsp20/alpha crystallin family protein [Fimbriimonadaceae bacterium]